MEGESVGGVFLTEGHLRGARVVGEVRVEISRQNASLSDVREQMAAEATRLGANVVIDFRYGQRAHRPLAHFNPFKWDSESWFGTGTGLHVG